MNGRTSKRLRKTLRSNTSPGAFRALKRSWNKTPRPQRHALLLSVQAMAAKLAKA